MEVNDFNITSLGAKIRGKISTPDGIVKGVLVCLHGSPGGDYHGNENIFDQLAHAVLDMGLATVQFSFYGSEPSDGKPAESCLRIQIANFQSVFEYVKAHFNAPIFVVGESAGATIASSVWKSEVAGYILLWPAFDLKDSDLGPYLNENWWHVVDKDGFLNDNGVIIGKELFVELLLKDFSPNFQLPNQETLIIHGQSDKEVPYSQSLKALNSASGNIDFFTRKNAGHGFKEQQDRMFVIEKITDWLIKRV
jgi:alpha/beta superfamily hydrolase